MQYNVPNVDKQIIRSLLRPPFLKFMAIKSVNYKSIDFPMYLCLNKYILYILKLIALWEFIF